MFIDEVTLIIQGGNGGNGKSSFFPKRGGPNGGDGGDGGNVYAVVNKQLANLNRLSGKHKLKGGDGKPGDSYRKEGARGKDLEIPVPLGTTIVNMDTAEEVELLQEDEVVLISRGGIGGRGNEAFKSSENQAPKYAEPGNKGQIKHIKFILKLIAHYGLIGLPNAGKSSLLNELTAAHAKTANYPFTTLQPNLGALGPKIIADIPGLIEGASAGRGLGTRFLKHIEKVELLLHCIPAESKDVEKDYDTVTAELKAYNPVLADKDSMLLLTKTDLVSREEVDKKIIILRKLNPKTMAVSIHHLESLEALKKTLINY